MAEKTNAEVTTIEATLGTRVKIELPSYGTSGFAWFSIFNPKEIKLAEKKLVDGKKTLGTTGKIVFQFIPLTTGNHEITFELKRVLEDEPTQTKTFVIKAQ
jgi:Chagasin family peptidase inhibitor I42.